MDWFWKAMIAMVCFMPVFIVTPYFQKNFGVRPETTLVWWNIGIVLGTGAVLQSRGEFAIVAFSRYTAIILCLGLTFGTIAGLALFGSLATAPNPGLTIAVVNVNAIVTFVIMLWLGSTFPQHFANAGFNFRNFVGILLTIAGVILIAAKKS